MVQKPRYHIGSRGQDPSERPLGESSTRSPSGPVTSIQDTPCPTPSILLSSNIQEQRTCAWVPSPALPPLCGSMRAGGWLAQGGASGQYPRYSETRHYPTARHPPRASGSVPVHRPSLSQASPHRATSTTSASLVPILAKCSGCLSPFCTPAHLPASPGLL